MLEIRIKIGNKRIIFIKTQGHTEPLICAGVSAIIQGGSQALYDLTKSENFVLRGGYALLNFNNSKISQCIANTLYSQLKLIADNYPKKITITLLSAFQEG